MEIQWHRSAAEELELAAEYYASERAGLGEEFLAEVNHAVKMLCDFPNAWPRVTLQSRRIRTRRFPYGLVYQLQADQIVILAVMHLRRKPGYWQDRED